MAAPVIGVTTSRMLNKQGLPAIYVMEAYVQAVAQAGGAPLLVPLGLGEQELQGIVARLDGVLLTGGGDIDPQQYMADGHPRVSEVDQDRDRVEIRLFKDVLQARLPFLGICRGLQLVNVALGGTLYTHITDQHRGALEHSFFPDWPRSHLAHTVQVEQGSWLASILGEQAIQVNSLHHQGVHKLAPGLQVSACAPDGLVEAIELSGHPFGLAVQWHPEWLLNQAGMRSLFRAFVEAAADG